MEWIKQIPARKTALALALAGALTLATAVPAYAMHPITFGTSVPDNLRGTSVSDDLRGLGGDDYLRGLGGNDTLRGGTGEDVVIGHGGNDYIYGGTGSDLDLNAGYGRDRVYGGLGDDHISAAYDGATDRIFGGDGNDDINVQDFSSAADIIDCGAGFDRVTVNASDNATKDVVAANCEVIRDGGQIVF